MPQADGRSGTPPSVQAAGEQPVHELALSTKAFAGAIPAVNSAVPLGRYSQLRAKYAGQTRVQIPARVPLTDAPAIHRPPDIP